MSGYTRNDLETLRDFYRDSLLNDTLPFWLPQSVDTEHGGYLLMRDRDGSLLDDDKSIWFQGRFSSILGNLYNTAEPRREWLEAAKAGVDFLRNHGFDSDGRMFFSSPATVNRSGNAATFSPKLLPLPPMRNTPTPPTMRLSRRRPEIYLKSAPNTQMAPEHFPPSLQTPDPAKDLECP